MKTTKITTLASTLIFTTALASQTAHASPKTAVDIQRATTFTASAIIGGIAGGPIGFMLGAIGGAYLGEQSKKAVATNDELSLAENEISQLESQLGQHKTKVAKMEKKIAKKLEFQVMFPTGKDAITVQDQERISSLSSYLKENNQLRVRLDGHADPRGTDEYNNVLSAERAKSIAAALENTGIAAERIEVYSHGSSFSTNVEANRDDYAFERRVNIEVFSDNNNSVATTH